MAEAPRETGRQTGRRIVLAQFGLAGLLGLSFWVFGSTRAGYSALTGGLISAMASWVFARWVFGRGDTSSEQFLRRVWFGELLKLGATVVMFVVAITQLDLAFLPLITAFAVTLLTYWVVLLFA